MPKVSSIVGEPFLNYVKGQIEHRQRVYGSGINRSRTPQELSYLNSRNSWIKLVSAVNVLTPSDPDGEVAINESGNIVEPGRAGESRLQRIFKSINQGQSQPYNNFTGENLARNFVLFNGTSTLQEDGTYSTRSGVTNDKSFANDSAYGLGGTEFGIQPMPGISGFNVNHKNNGALRDGEITLTAYNRFQFDVIETLYLRLGYTMLIEWGNSIWYDTNANENPQTYNTMGTTMADKWWWDNQKKGINYLQILEEIERNRQKYSGNYDGFICVVRNFKWSVETDGTYSISIQFSSLGSVIESLKVDTISPAYTFKQNTGEVDVNELNKSTIGNYLYIQKVQNAYSTHLKPLTPNIQNADLLDLLGFEERHARIINKDYRHYLRLGHLLAFMEEHVLRYYKNNDKCFPIFNIDYTSQSLCNISKDLISIDPKICIIKPEASFLRDSLGRTEDEFPFWSKVLRDFFVKGRTDNEYFGVINNIYISFNFIESCLPQDDVKGLDFSSFLTKILNGINSCFGGYMNLGITLQEENNLLVIRDENLKPGVKVSLKEDGTIEEISNFQNENYPIFDWLGYNRGNGTSNFLTNFTFETFLSNNFLNQVSIGATAANQSVNEDATAYEQWSLGLLDGYKQGGTDGQPLGCPRNEVEIKEDNNPIETAFILNTAPLAPSATVSPTLVNEDDPNRTLLDVVGNLFKSIANNIRENLRKVEEAQREVYLSWHEYVNKAFAIEALTGGTRGFERGKYFQADEDFVARGKVILDNRRETRAKESKNKLGNPSGYVGYLPAELSLTLDGLSGIRIYNGLKLNSDLLPYNYPEALDFIIIGVDHSLVDNDWQTTLRAIPSPARSAEDLPIPADPEAFESSEGETTRGGDAQGRPSPTDIINENLPEVLSLYPPTNITGINSIIRNDSGGSGIFGASRSGRAHRGIDLQTTLTSATVDLGAAYPILRGLPDFRTVNSQVRYGTQIYAPIDGITKLTRATTNSKLPGCKIIGTGEYAGVEVFIFYMHTNSDLRWNKPVRRGQALGYGLDLSLDYPENVGDHIHFAVKKNGVYIDPSNFAEVNYVT